MESSPIGTVLISVKANDKDLETSEFGKIRYQLGGENSNLFTIDEISGQIKVSGKKVIDREKTSTLKLTVFALDTPHGGHDQKRTSVSVNTF